MGCDGFSPIIKTCYSYFNPRSPNGLRQDCGTDNTALIIISIHAARMGCDWHTLQYLCCNQSISIHAARMGCDAEPAPAAPATPISIHAARMGCDIKLPGRKGAEAYFNPRSPNGLRPNVINHYRAYAVISIHAARMGCDRRRSYLMELASFISIHAARMGCDKTNSNSRTRDCDFNPRSPNGLRQIAAALNTMLPEDFNPRSPNGLRHSPKAAWKYG